jgi:hypothetical protein
MSELRTSRFAPEEVTVKSLVAIVISLASRLRKRLRFVRVRPRLLAPGIGR